MDVLTGLEELFVVAAISALAPLLAALIPGQRIPQLVLLLLGGIVVGPQGLGIKPNDELELIANVGLGFVFLLAGYEIDPRIMVARAGRLALTAWVVAAAASVAIVGGLDAIGYVDAFVPVALALTTTALGTVLPTLREQGMLGGAFGRHFLASGAVGELLPILAIAIFLGVNSRLSALASIAAIGTVALVLVVAARVLQGRVILRIVAGGADSTGQTTLRWTVMLLVGLLVIAGEFGLDVVLGAFLAGAVLRHWAPGEVEAFEGKLDAIGYGFFIPIFFVVAGMGVDVASIRESPSRLLVFLVLLLLVRGLPVLAVYRRELAIRERTQLMLCTATTLPLLVALAQIGVDNGTMLSENAAAIVGAGVLSVLLFPLGAALLQRPDAADPPEQALPEAGPVD